MKRNTYILIILFTLLALLWWCGEDLNQVENSAVMIEFPQTSSSCGSIDSIKL